MSVKPRRERNFVAHHLSTVDGFSGVDLCADTDHSVALNIMVGHNLWRARVETPTLKPTKHTKCREIQHVAAVIADIKQGIEHGSLIGTTTTDLCTSKWAVQEVRHG